LEQVDAVVVTRAFAPQWMRFKPEIPVVVVTFTIDRQSVEYLKGRIQQESQPVQAVQTLRAGSPTVDK
jgi:hypothetical protein